MTKENEFNLSEKIYPEGEQDTWGMKSGYLDCEDIKEFIRRLKEEMRNYNTVQQRIRFINKLAGEKLI